MNGQFVCVLALMLFCPPLQLEEYDKGLEEVPMKELLKMNGSEWPFITLGIIGSLVEGSAFPVFAILFGEVLRVRLCCQLFHSTVVLVYCTHIDSTALL